MFLLDDVVVYSSGDLTLAATCEFALLRRAINRRLGPTGLKLGLIARLWVSSGLAAAVAWGFRLVVPPLHPILLAAIVFTPYALIYMAMTMGLGVEEARALVARARRGKV